VTRPRRATRVHFLRAIEIARRQAAKSLELRATVSLSRLWADTGKLKEAHALLSALRLVHGGVRHRRPDEAKSLIEELETEVAMITNQRS